jgi:hypothetical protein
LSAQIEKLDNPRDEEGRPEAAFCSIPLKAKRLAVIGR